MGIKKTTKKLQAAIDTDLGKKKRAKKINKLVDELGKKKKKFEAKASAVEGEKKKLDQKIGFCEAGLAKGRAALNPAPAKPLAVAADPKSAQKENPQSDGSPEVESELPKAGRLVRPVKN